MSTTSGGNFAWRGFAACAGASGLIILGALPGFAADTGLLSEKPPRAASTNEFEARTSTIAPSIDVSYGVLADAANLAADRFAGPRSGRTRIGCQRIGFGASLPVGITLFHGCEDFDWQVNASRNGSISVQRAGDGIVMNVPVKFTGTGTVVGDLGKTVASGSKNFSGSFIVSISGAVHVDKSFCPEVEQPTARFAWSSAPDIDVIGHTCIEIGHGKACIGPWKFPAGQMLTDQINHALADQVSEINKKIPCDKIRGELQQLWKDWSIPVAITNPPLYVSIQPKSLSIPGVFATDSGIRINARLDASTSVSPVKPANSAPLELPENAPPASPPGRFSLAVPLAIPYPLLAAAGGWRMIGKSLTSGKSAITPTAIEFLPSNDRLAVGVTLRADAPATLQGKTGTLWFTGTAKVDDNGHAVRLDNLATTPRVRQSPLGCRPADNRHRAYARSRGELLVRFFRPRAGGAVRTEPGDRESEEYRRRGDQARQ